MNSLKFVCELQLELNDTCPCMMHGRFGATAVIRSLTQALVTFIDGGFPLCFQFLGEVKPVTSH